MSAQLKAMLKAQADPQKAKILSSFFKTGPGQYGEGDVFLGLTVPVQRGIAARFSDLSLDMIEGLLKSPVHEERLTALLILVGQFKRGDDAQRKEIYRFYLRNASRVNNWDLVDSSAHHIVGAYLDGRSIVPLLKLARSKLLWERRIAMVATWDSIQKGKVEPALTIAKILLYDEHDLMHKAVGWMLREVGKRASQSQLEKFLLKHYKVMPRTMLRYAIERFPETKRQKYLKGTL